MKPRLTRRDFLTQSTAAAVLTPALAIPESPEKPKSSAASTSAEAPHEKSHEKPKVRAITGFVQLDPARHETQIHQTLAFLHGAKTTFEKSGYDVEGVRITTQPFPEYARGLSREDTLSFFRAYDGLAAKENFDAAIGPAMSTDTDDPSFAEMLGEIIMGSAILEGSLAVAGDDGIHWNAVRAAAKLVRYVALRTPHSQGNFRFAATALLPPLTPFYPGSYHVGPGRAFALALESANVVAEALTGKPDYAAARESLIDSLSVHARAIEAAAKKIEQATHWTYAGIDLSPAPFKNVSIGGAIEKLTGVKFGASGTMTACALITGALKEIPVKHAGYSGLMLPILEDAVLAQRWSEGIVSMDALLAYSAVCGTGLDVIPLPGNTTQAQLERILGDVASLAVKWHKPLSARLLPVAGKKAGEQTEFDDPFLVNATVQELRH